MSASDVDPGITRRSRPKLPGRWRSARDVVPTITDRRGKQWKQPPRRDILISPTHAAMTLDTFDKLMRYDTSTPSGVYAGKMWARVCDQRALLVWFGQGPEKNVAAVRTRAILLCG